MESMKSFFASQKAALLDEAQAIVDRYEATGQRLTAADKAKVEGLVAQASGYRDRIKKIEDGETLRASMEVGHAHQEEAKKMTTTETKTSFSDAVIGAGFHYKHMPSVSLSAVAALGGKANVFPAVTDWNRTEPVTVSLGQDTRFLYPNLQIQDAGDAGSIQDFKQSARTLVGTVKRALDATSDKAHVDSTLAIVNEALSQFAITVDDVPNQLFESVGNLRGFLDQEARFQIQVALDSHVVSQIAAAGPAFGNTGADMITKIRNAIGEMRTLGANPDIVAINATDAAALDLLTDAGGYIFSTRRAGDASPLFDLKLVEMPGSTPPYVIDSRMLGVLYLGRMDFAVDPFTGFRKNLSTLRAETKALLHVRNIQGARRIASA